MANTQRTTSQEVAAEGGPTQQPPEPDLTTVATPDDGRPAYRVVGPHAVFGVEPGGIVKPDVTRDQLSVLLGAGHIALDNGPAPA